MKSRRAGVLLAAVLVGGVGVGEAVYRTGHTQTRYATAAVDRGNVHTAVSATGTLNAVVTIQVGTQVSGTIQQLFVDYNSPVRKGQLIARIDPATSDTKVNQAKADVENAQATVAAQQAAVTKAQADLENATAMAMKDRVAVRDATVKWQARERLYREGNLSQEDRDTAQATDDSAAADLVAGQAGVRAAQAALEVAQAQLAAAEATVRQKQAALAQAQVDLANTAIRAPVDGVVVARNVDVGQTVAASLQAPTLFVIANDLTQMQVDTNIDEADIGRIALGQAATFTVDAYPGQRFEGHVIQIRQAPQIVDNVVTYDAVVAAQNPALQFKPGMTAGVRFVTARHDGVLVVPNAAFRVHLDGTAMASGERPVTTDRPSPGGPASTLLVGTTGAKQGDAREARQVLWVLHDGRPERRQVQVGLTDGDRTEIVVGLQAGEQVIIGRTTP
jgi:HlyD family secretion protein